MILSASDRCVEREDSIRVMVFDIWNFERDSRDVVQAESSIGFNPIPIDFYEMLRWER